ncbi:MAG: Uma2 family endonuclease [Trueperaceae bacterium]
MSKVIDNSYEVERGKPMPSEIHGYIQSQLILEIGSHYRNQYTLFSELTLELNGWRAVPDISIYPKRKMNFREDRIEVTNPPLCAIEILSPSQSLQELVNKADRYFQYGVKSCWLVIPSLVNIYVFSSPEIYTMFRSQQLLKDEMLGLELELATIFS